MLSSIRNFLFSSQANTPEKMAEVKQLVDSTISGNKIVVFSKSYCPYCRRAKELLRTKYSLEKPAILELDERDDGSQIQKYLAEKTGQSTVPSIFIREKHIGGSSDLQDLESEGKLKTLIDAE